MSRSAAKPLDLRATFCAASVVSVGWQRMQGYICVVHAPSGPESQKCSTEVGGGCATDRYFRRVPSIALHGDGKIQSPLRVCHVRALVLLSVPQTGGSVTRQVLRLRVRQLLRSATRPKRCASQRSDPQCPQTRRSSHQPQTSRTNDE